MEAIFGFNFDLEVRINFNEVWWGLQLSISTKTRNYQNSEVPKLPILVFPVLEESTKYIVAVVDPSLDGGWESYHLLLNLTAPIQPYDCIVYQTCERRRVVNRFVLSWE